MADRLRLVTLSAGGRPVVVRDLESAPTYMKARDTFVVTPPAKTSRMVAQAGRYGGSRSVGERQENGAIAATWRVKGTSQDNAIANVEALLADVENEDRGRFLEWRPAGATQSVLYELRGPGTWTPKYAAIQFRQGIGMDVEITWPVATLAQGLPMDVADDFSQDSIGDYTLRSGTGIAVTTGALRPTGTSLKRIAYTGRGYKLGDVQVTSEVIYGTTVVSNEGPPAVKILDATNAIFATYGGGALTVYKMDNEALTVLASVAVTAPAASSRRRIRLRIEGNVLTAEWWTATPTPTGAPTNTVSWTLTGADATKFGAGVVGDAGIWYWTPHSSLTSYVDSLEILPYVYRNRSLPEKISLQGNIPGTAPALADLDVGMLAANEGARTAWFAAGWAVRAAPTTSPPALGPLDLGNYSTLWIPQTDATARGGSYVGDLTPTSSEYYRAVVVISSGALPADDFSDEIQVEFWARVKLNQSLVTPRLALSLETGTGLVRYTEWGAAGRLVAVPSATAWRMVRLGSMSVPSVDRDMNLLLDGTLGVGSGGSAWGVDYLFCMPTRQRVAGPSGKALDVSYPAFAPPYWNYDSRRVIRSDGRGFASITGQSALTLDRGLGGAPIEPNPGPLDLVVKGSNLVPDDPTVSAASEALTQTATIHLAVTPRFRLARSV